jgi:predicted phosphohydrolase
MIKIRYFSDLHLEFINPKKIYSFLKNIQPGVDDICILAGDIGNPYESNYNIFMNFIDNNFKKSFVISGNHEYYNNHKSIEDTNIFLVEYFKKFNNISFLNNTYEDYENFCFVGTTLWSKIYNPEYKINDVYSIHNFDYIKYNNLNISSIAFLEDTLLKNNNCIVITHHLPSNSLIDIKYKTQKMLPYNQWFYCNLDNLIETYRDKLKCWIYGHTHMSSYNIINGIPFICNPIGYPNENSNLDFQKNIMISI